MYAYNSGAYSYRACFSIKLLTRYRQDERQFHAKSSHDAPLVIYFAHVKQIMFVCAAVQEVGFLEPPSVAQIFYAIDSVATVIQELRGAFA